MADEPDVHDLDVEHLLAEQIAYYRARAPEYDEWWEREGSFDLGPEFRSQWLREIAHVQDALKAFAPSGKVLELAAGTGIWTEQLARYSRSITALDASAETLEISRSKLAGSAAPVEYLQADLFDWEPDFLYDVVFFGFWLTHVPDARFERFWELVRSAMEPNGRFFFVDNAAPEREVAARFPQTVSRQGQTFMTRWSTTDPTSGTSLRRLSDGTEYRIVKVFWEPESLQQKLLQLGWKATVRRTEHFFVYGEGSPS